MLHRTGSAARAGFTLIELLVVVTIIILLIALTLAGIGYARNSARAVQTTNDIRALDEATTAFKAKFSNVVPPSHFVERASDGNFYVRQFQVPHRIDMPEYQVFRRMYPRWDPVNQGGMDPADATGMTIHVNARPARGSSGPGGLGEILDNNQVMVYFLGGPTNQGWSNAGPVAPSTTGNTKINPFFEFPAGDQFDPVGPTASRFRDPYGVPYAYFSSNTENDRYDPRAQFPWVDGGNRQFAWGTASVAPNFYDPNVVDPNATTVCTAHPMMSPGGKWLAPGRWQIISAGKDKKFGYGSFNQTGNIPYPYAAATPSVNPPVNNGGYDQKARGDDDLSNFASGILGVN